jgi:hypothetical protein
MIINSPKKPSIGKPGGGGFGLGGVLCAKTENPTKSRRVKAVFLSVVISINLSCPKK